MPDRIRPWTRIRRAIQLFRIAWICCAASVFPAQAGAQATPAPGAVALPPDAVLPSESMHSLAARADPNVVIDLAIKSSNVGAAHRGGFDMARVHAGHWDAMGCYAYLPAEGHFRRIAGAQRLAGGGIACQGQWSGNLLNWATASALDTLRMALTGGDRVVDEPARTVLQRAVLPEDFYRSDDFPTKTLAGHLDRLTPLVAGRAGDPSAADTIHIHNCGDRFFVGPSAEGRCNRPGRDQAYGPGGMAGPYLARVEVCTGAEAATRRDLCIPYPSGHHKPAGALQAHAGRMRFAVFGYLPGENPAQYGGVLREPMKYIGPRRTDAAFDTVENPHAEWDAHTGVFKADPPGPFGTPGRDGTVRGGVVNAVNRFGRGGRYARFDPAGELFYESLRYLQAKPPTLEATAGLHRGDPARTDGLPVRNGTSAWSGARAADPVDAGCRRNNILTLGDLDTHHDRSLPGLGRRGSAADFERAADGAALEPDTAYWTRLVGAFENGEALGYAHPSGKVGLSTTGRRGLPTLNYKGGAVLTSASIADAETGAIQGSFGMAGLAYWARTQRIRSDRPDLRVQTFAIDLDAGGRGIVGARQRGSAAYLAAKYGGFADRDEDGSPFETAGDTGQPDDSEWAEGLDDDGQPRPANYFVASAAQPMGAALRRVFRGAAVMPSPAQSGAALSSRTVGDKGAGIYLPRSDERRGSGTLLSYPVVLDAATGSLRIADVPAWDAGALLDGRDTAGGLAPDPARRKIFTLSAAGSGIPFEWEALDPALRTFLSTEPEPSLDAAQPPTDAFGPDRLAYLRGERGKEASFVGGRFRVRDSAMGGVAHASPVHVGAPDPALHEAGYGEFLARHRDRQPAVYLGTSDGMLHAFSGRSGEELFAYVPRLLFPALSALTSADRDHRAYVDATPVVAEARTAEGRWRSVLVSGLGGAAGVFALDVSDPAAFTAGKVLWEFGRADDSDMGHLTQPPRILKFRITAAARGHPAVHAWFAVVPSGFNNAHPEKRAALFLLSLDKPPGVPWQQGVNYHKILLPRPADGTLVNGFASAPGDHAAADGSVRFLYAGDSQGNLWKFDFSGNAPWSETNALAYGEAPLMVAMEGGAGSRRQPITVQPEVGLGPSGGAIVLFGTGKFMEPADLGRSRYGLQTVYAIQDTGAPIRAGEARAQLAPRRVVEAGEGKLRMAGEPFVYGAFDARTTRRRGWYLDLPASRDRGERQVAPPVLESGYLFFNTLIPPPAICGKGGGRSCAIDAMSGLSDGGSCVPTEAGMPGAPFVLQVGDVSHGAGDPVGRRLENRRLAVLSPGMRGKGAGVSIAQPIDGGGVALWAGRLSWRQLADHRRSRP